MKRVLFLLALGFLVSRWDPAESLGRAEPIQDAQSISGRALVGMFHSQDAGLRRKALSLIGDIYASRYNNGVIPEEDTLYGLGQVVAGYLAAHPNKMDLVAEKVVIEALKGAAEGIQAQKVFWETAYKAAEAYFLDPSPENGETLYRSLPDRRLPGLDFKGLVRLSHLFYDYHLSDLMKKAAAGDPYALDIGFRLINISDGAFGEDLVYGLGTVIPGHPRLFLEKLLANQGKTEPPILELLDGILHPVGWWEMPKNDPDYIKYRELRNAKLDIRIKALETVRDPHLEAIRDRCISILKKMSKEKSG